MRTSLVQRVAAASARRPKTMIALWLLLVIGCLTAGAMTGTKTLEGADGGVGESGRADHRLEAAGLDGVPVENVLVRSDDPAKTAQAVDALSERVTDLDAVKDVSAEATKAGGKTTLVSITLRGDPDDAQDVVEPIEQAVADDPRPRRHPPAGRRRHRRQGLRHDHRGGPQVGRADLAADHPRRAGDRVRRARRRARPAAARHHRRRRRDGRRRRHLPDRPRRRRDELDDHADRPRRRRRLLALLHPPRARGTRRRQGQAGRAGGDRGHRRPRDRGLRADGHRRARRPARHRPVGLREHGARRRWRRRDRRDRLAHRAPRDARAARRQDQPRPPAGLRRKRPRTRVAPGPRSPARSRSGLAPRC